MHRITLISECVSGGLATYTRDFLMYAGPIISHNVDLQLIALARGAPRIQRDLWVNTQRTTIFAATPIDCFFLLMLETFRRHPNVIHLQFPPTRSTFSGIFFEPLVAFCVASYLVHIPLIVTLHSLWETTNARARAERYFALKPVTVLATEYYKSIIRLLLRVCVSTVVMSQYFSGLLIRDYRVKPEKIQVIPHGTIPLPHLSGTAHVKESVLNGRRIVLCIGHIWHAKGIELLIEALPEIIERVPNVHLLIAGSPKEREGEVYLKQLRDLAVRVGVEGRITFDTGYLREEVVRKYISSASVVVLPYTIVAGPSGVINLAHSYLKPVVSTDFGPRREELDDGGLGILVSSANSNALADAVAACILSRRLVGRLVQNMKRHIRMTNLGEVGRRYLREYLRIIQASQIVHSCHT